MFRCGSRQGFDLLPPLGAELLVDRLELVLLLGGQLEILLHVFRIEESQRVGAELAGGETTCLLPQFVQSPHSLQRIGRRRRLLGVYRRAGLRWDVRRGRLLAQTAFAPVARARVDNDTIQKARLM